MLELDLTADIQALRSTFADIQAVVDVDALKADIDRLSEEAGAPDLWDDVDKAQKVTSSLSHKQAELKRVSEIEQRLDDLEVLVELAIEMEDDESADEARRELASLKDVIGQLEVQTLLDGEYDPRSAVVTIRSGAGGDDATDFAEMLLRMYLRWAERHKYPVKVMDTSYAEAPASSRPPSRSTCPTPTARCRSRPARTASRASAPSAAPTSDRRASRPSRSSP